LVKPRMSMTGGVESLTTVVSWVALVGVAMLCTVH